MFVCFFVFFCQNHTDFGKSSAEMKANVECFVFSKKEMERIYLKLYKTDEMEKSKILLLENRQRKYVQSENIAADVEN